MIVAKLPTLVKGDAYITGSVDPLSGATPPVIIFIPEIMIPAWACRPCSAAIQVDEILPRRPEGNEATALRALYAHIARKLS